MIEKNRMEEIKSELDKSKMLIKMFAEITGDKSAEFKVKIIELLDLLNNIAINMDIITDEQYEELMNCIDQFIKVIEKYLKEKEIKLKKKI